MADRSQEGVRETLEQFVQKFARENWRDSHGIGSYIDALAQAVQERTAREAAEIAWDAKTNWDAKSEILAQFNLKEGV